MKQAKQMNFILDQDWHASAKGEIPEIVQGDSFLITVASVYEEASETSATDALEFEVHPVKGTTVEISSSFGRMEIALESEEQWLRFVNGKLAGLAELLASTVYGEDQEDLLWVEKSDGDLFWIFGLLHTDRGWTGVLVERRDPETKNESSLFFGAHDENERKREAGDLFELLEETLAGEEDSEEFCLLTRKPYLDNTPKRELTIKLHRDALWFRFFPIDYFCASVCSNYGTLHRYWRVHWIVTEGSFPANTVQRRLLQSELSNLCTFLRHSIVILNVYPMVWRAKLLERAKRGTDLVGEVLSLFENVDITTDGNQETLSLKWYVDPGKEQVCQLLRDPNTRYVFGDFHVESKEEEDVWVIPGTKEGRGSEFINVSDFKDKDLSHIRLMKLFHCRSVYDFYESEKQKSIVDKLLCAGAQRVEGSIVDAPYLPHVCSLLRILTSEEGYGLVSMGQCLAREVDYFKLKQRVDEFIAECRESEC